MKNDFSNSPTARLRNLGPHNCRKQGYSGSQMNWDTEILCGRVLMTWLPMMININKGVSGMCHCLKTNLPYPLILMLSFFIRDEIFKMLPLPPKFFGRYRNPQCGMKQVRIDSLKIEIKILSGPKVMNGQTGVAFCWHPIMWILRMILRLPSCQILKNKMSFLFRDHAPRIWLCVSIRISVQIYSKSHAIENKTGWKSIKFRKKRI